MTRRKQIEELGDVGPRDGEDEAGGAGGRGTDDGASGLKGLSKGQDGGVLTDELAIREHSVAACKALLPSRVGDRRFEWMTQGRSAAMKAAGKLYSTCGDLGGAVLWCLGYRGPALNRDLEEGDGGPRRWKVGLNIYHLTGKPAVDDGLFVRWRTDLLPGMGDLLYVSNGPPRTEHVSILERKDTELTDEEQRTIPDGCEAWIVWQAGGGGVFDQHGSQGRSVYALRNPKRPHAELNGRRLVGWLSMANLVGKLAMPARLPPF